VKPGFKTPVPQKKKKKKKHAEYAEDFGVGPGFTL
jgi:hypothetical protein